MLEGVVGDLLRAAEQGQLLGVLDGAQARGDVAMQAREQRRDGGTAELRLQPVVEGQVDGVLDGHHPRPGLGDATGGPQGRVDDLHIELPGRIRPEFGLEHAEVTRVGMQPEAI